MNDLFIRPIEDRDARAVSGLMSSLGYSLSPSEAALRICRIRELPMQGVYVAIINQETVGLIAVSYGTMLHLDKPVARITTLVVDPNMRRMKIGQALVNRAIEFAHQNMCEGIEVTTNLKRQDAVKFYQNNGFTITSKRLYKVCD